MPLFHFLQVTRTDLSNASFWASTAIPLGISASVHCLGIAPVLGMHADFEVKQQKAANLEAYEKQLADMQELLKTMFRQLPSKTEMDKLLVDVSQTALGAGIDVQLFEPLAESFLDFYAERPIAIRMLGDYHEFGDFVSGVAALPRVVILTMHDISLKRATAGQSRFGDSEGRLVLEGTVKTYRYVDEEEVAQRSAEQAP